MSNTHGQGRGPERGTGTGQRFYTRVGVARHPEEAGYALLLDGAPLRTPAGRILNVPDVTLAERCAEEWRAQGPLIRHPTLILNNLLFAAADDPAALVRWAQAEWARFSASDLLCYWPEGDARLAARCEDAWQPILRWAEDVLGAAIIRATGLQFVAQEPALLMALDRALAAKPALVQGAMAKLASLFGSALLALGVAHGRISAAEAVRLARLDEDYQAEIWGEDPEAAARARALEQEVLAFAAVVVLPAPA